MTNSHWITPKRFRILTKDCCTVAEIVRKNQKISFLISKIQIVVGMRQFDLVDSSMRRPTKYICKHRKSEKLFLLFHIIHNSPLKPVFLGGKPMEFGVSENRAFPFINLFTISLWFDVCVSY